MKQSRRAEKCLNSIYPLYQRQRVAAYAYAYAMLRSEKDAFNCCAKAYTTAALRCRTILRKAEPDIEAFRIVMAETASLRKKLESSGEDIKKRRPDPRTEQLFSDLTEDELAVWVLRRIARFNPHEASRLLQLSLDELNACTDSADAKLIRYGSPDERGDRLRLVFASLCGEKDIWNTVSFNVERRTNHTNIAVAVMLGLVAAGLLFLLGREGYYLISVLSMPKMTTEYEAVTVDEADPDYWRNTNRAASDEYPNMTESLYNALGAYDDDELIRVDFGYYDAAVMRKYVTDDGLNLQELYIKTYVDAANAGRLDICIINAIGIYYSEYEMPFSVATREKDFASKYGTLYDCLQHYLALHANDESSFTVKAVAAFPEILTTREGFEEYLTGEFSSSIYWLAEIVSAEMLMQEYLEDPTAYTAEEAKQLRYDYEHSLFRYKNGNLIEIVPSSYKLSNESLINLYYSRTQLGEAMCAEMDEDVRAMELGNLTSNMAVDKYMCSYTADFTKAEIFELAQDGRFWFSGLATTPTAEGYPDGLESLLYCMVANENPNADGKYEVYLVNDEYYHYNHNYVVEIALPYGFIQGLYEQMPEFRGSVFEFEQGYVCRVLYGHRRVLTRYGLLRMALDNPDDLVLSTRYKYYPRIGGVE